MRCSSETRSPFSLRRFRGSRPSKKVELTWVIIYFPDHDYLGQDGVPYPPQLHCTVRGFSHFIRVVIATSFLLAISEHSAAFVIHQWCINRAHYAIASLSYSRGSPSFVETLPHEVLGHPLILQCVVHDQRVADLLGHPRRNRFKAEKTSVNVVSS